MANELTQEFTLPKSGYAAFDAISLRNLIIQRLNDQGILTDQNYIGSNLASIIDIVSYSFNTLIFYLNQTSTESSFTEAQLYENINRIVKILDYKPIGYQTSTLAFECSAIIQQGGNAISFSPGDYTIPRYSYVIVGQSSFSFNEDVSFVINSDQYVYDSVNMMTGQELTDVTNKKLLYQGMYRENPVYTAAGDPNEVVAVNVTDALIDHFNLDVYVYENRLSKWIEYKQVSNFYTENANSRSFEKRLNSELLYEISFGDGINGRKLESGDKVAIYYLQSSGTAGVIGPGIMSSVTVLPTIFSSSTLNTILQDINEQETPYLSFASFAKLKFNNIVGSTLPKDIEDVDSIRKNAPATFKSQYRLVTQEDYQSFISTNFANFIVDAKVFSNWDYTGKYLKYFYDLGVKPEGFRQIMLNQVLYADACNFNNIYICAVPRVSQGSSLKYLLPAQKEIIVSNMQSLKTLTTEVTFMDPIFKSIAFGIKTGDTVDVSTVNFFQLRVVKRAMSGKTPKSIQQQIVTIFRDFFNPVNAKLGGVFDYSSLVNMLLSVEGVSRIYTIKTDTNTIYEGVSFFMWNPTYPDLDKQSITNNIFLQDFELPYFNGLSTIESKIVIEES